MIAVNATVAPADPISLFCRYCTAAATRDVSAPSNVTAELKVSEDVSKVIIPLVIECDFTVAPAIVNVESLLPVTGNVGVGPVDVAAEGDPCKSRKSWLVLKLII